MTKRDSDNKHKDTCLRSPCPVAATLDILGDKWTLLVVRDLFFADRTYGEFLRSPEGIPTNILAERLKRLEKAGIISKYEYQQKPVRYRYTLTAKGRDLGPVMKAVVNWGTTHIPGAYSLDEIKAIITRHGAKSKTK